MLLRQAPAFALLAGALALTVMGPLLACGTDAKGIDACKRIERVRCESAGACGVDLSRPVHRGDSPSADVGACVRYYDEACLHGLASGVEPGNVAVDACIKAIETGSCDVVRTPETATECSFLLPAPAPAPAPAATDAGTTTDGG